MSDQLPVDHDSLLKGLQSTHARVKVADKGNVVFLKLAKEGHWVYGADETDVQEGSVWAVDPNSFVQGYIAWQSDKSKAAEKLGEEMVRATDAPINKATLPDVGAPWQEQLGCSLLCLTGEDAGKAASYSTTAKGGIRAMNTLIGEVVGKLQTGEVDEIIPVVEMQVDSYRHKTYGKIFVPIFKIHRWEDLSSSPDDAKEPATEDELEQADSAPEPPPEAQRRRTRRPAVA